ncbi:SulA-like leucine-rich domain-containing protein [Rheinheimera sp.]|jgi:cell division inhibitor SulA|uniref:SulA-like leucine-rich domain-containing protein n=1 Tax=Rheinheimera sp. TaxID=1869214 RepID=UPI003D2E329F
MRQLTLTTSVSRLPQSALNRQQTGYFKEIAEDNIASICQTLAVLTKSGDAQQGWILVLAPQHHLSKQLLEQCQIDCQRLLVIGQKQVHRYDNLMRDALTCSTCSAVLSFLPGDCAELADYQYLANKYQTQLINHCSMQTPTAH